MNWETHIEPISDQMIALTWENPETYKWFIAQVYYFVRYSTKMLASAASLTDNPDFYRRLIAHIREEEGHDKLALADLKNLGGELKDYPELGITRSLWESQFFKIQRQPTALLGYILSLEMIPVKSYHVVLPIVQKLYGEKAVNFIRIHCEEDPEHVAEAITQIDVTSEIEREEIEKNFVQTSALFAHLLDAVVKLSAPGYNKDQPESRLVQPLVFQEIQPA